MEITLVYAPAPRQVLECVLQLPEGSTLLAALQASAWPLQHPELLPDAGNATTVCGIWGRKADPATVLRDGDRVEFWRPLRVDPKVARRERFRAQGSKSAGLFAQRRPGAKPGY